MVKMDYRPKEQSFEANDGAKIVYHILGDEDNPSLMLIHGWGVSKEYWRPQYPLSRFFRLIIPDLRGYGGSERKGPYTISRMVVDLLDLARQESVEYVVGHSMGGVVAQQLAANFPDMFRGVVLAATFARLSAPFTAKFFQKAIPLVSKIDLRSFARFASNLAYNVDKKTKLFFYRMYIKCDKDVLLENAKDLLSYDGTWSLPSIDAPTLIIHGDHDPVVPPSHADYLASYIPDAHILIMRDAGHEVNYNDPDLFNSAILGFLTYATKQ